MNDEFFMRKALEEAQQAFEQEEIPVGAVIVCNNRIVAKAHNLTEKLNDVTAHAEMQAFTAAANHIGGKYLKDCTLYVTLEPCSHWGKTPPCTEEIVGAGVREVIIGMKDPNPLVNGYEILKLRGLKTRIGILEKECEKLNEGYVKYMKKKMPVVTLKAGMTLDGKIATSTLGKTPLVEIESPMRGDFDKQVAQSFKEPFYKVFRCNGNGVCFSIHSATK